jgi:hypothetical protein
MIDIKVDLKKRFDWAMYHSLEAYEVQPDGKSIVRSEDDYFAIDAFEKLLDTVDSIPSSLIEASEELRAAQPQLFEKLLVHGVQVIGPEFSPKSAAEFVEVLNRTVQREMAKV